MKSKADAVRRTPAGDEPVGGGRATSERVVRDSFTMPRRDYEQIGKLKARCIGLGIARSKSELLRAGLVALNEMTDAGLARIAAAVPSVKTGRPPGAKKKGKRKKSCRVEGKKK